MTVPQNTHQRTIIEYESLINVTYEETTRQELMEPIFVTRDDIETQYFSHSSACQNIQRLPDETWTKDNALPRLLSLSKKIAQLTKKLNIHYFENDHIILSAMKTCYQKHLHLALKSLQNKVNTGYIWEYYDDINILSEVFYSQNNNHFHKKDNRETLTALYEKCIDNEFRYLESIRSKPNLIHVMNASSSLINLLSKKSPSYHFIKEENILSFEKMRKLLVEAIYLSLDNVNRMDFAQPAPTSTSSNEKPPHAITARGQSPLIRSLMWIPAAATRYKKRKELDALQKQTLHDANSLQDKRKYHDTLASRIEKVMQKGVSHNMTICQHFCILETLTDFLYNNIDAVNECRLLRKNLTASLIGVSKEILLAIATTGIPEDTDAIKERSLFLINSLLKYNILDDVCKILHSICSTQPSVTISSVQPCQVNVSECQTRLTHIFSLLECQADDRFLVAEKILKHLIGKKETLERNTSTSFMKLIDKELLDINDILYNNLFYTLILASNKIKHYSQLSHISNFRLSHLFYCFSLISDYRNTNAIYNGQSH